MKYLEKLLENYWIIKDEDKELYYNIKDQLPTYKNFLNEKLGYHVIVNPYLIKLEKLPGVAEPWMGIQEFDTTMEYALLCLLLMFLEDIEREGQFVLSNITQFIEGSYPGDEKIDWTLYKHRRALIKTLRFASDIGLIKVNDGDEQNFANDKDTEVLYESTGTSRYFVRNFTTSIINYTSYEDLEEDNLGDVDMDKGILRRHRVYRRLLMSPIIYNQGSHDHDYGYIKNYRNVIENDFERYLNLPLHIHRNGAMVMLPEIHTFRDVFPNNKTISDIVLQMNMSIRKAIEKEQIILEKDDTLTISIVTFEQMVKELKEQNGAGWSKEYRETKLERLISEILKFMKDFNMIEMIHGGKEVRILPLVGKIVGSYSKDIEEKLEGGS